MTMMEGGWKSCWLLILAILTVFAHPTGGRSSKSCFNLPRPIKKVCNCKEFNGELLQLNCKGLNSTSIFDGQANQPEADLDSSINSISVKPNQKELEQESKEKVEDIIIRDSQIACVNFQNFNEFFKLKKLTLSSAGLKHLADCHKTATPKSTKFKLHSLTVIGNPHLERVEREQLPQDLVSGLKHLNLSGNSIKFIDPIFKRMEELESLDLSSNFLDGNLTPSTFKSIPLQALKHLDISGNPWPCTPNMAWIFSWSQPLVASGTLKKISATRCLYDETNYDSPLLLVMQYYNEHILPSCPKKDHCTCLLNSIQEKIVTKTDRAYSVLVSCKNKGLTHFPKLPKHTKTVDLSGNRLNGSAFENLQVVRHNYDEVSSLTLDNNFLESLPEKLLDMELSVSFSAINNKLTSISYDFSQRLVKTTMVIKLSNNPWLCSCSSQITDRNLMAKLNDRNEMTCGPESEPPLRNKKILSLDQNVLCPPEGNGESTELLLELLCCLLSVLIVLVLAKLCYDYSVYRRRGQLPWLALKMP